MRLYGEVYAQSPTEMRLARIRREHFMQHFAQLDLARVLEVGCGLDPIIDHLPESSSAVVVDPLEAHLESVRSLDSRKVLGCFPDVDLPNGWKPTSIFILCLLHEIENPLEILTQASELLSPGGRVVISVPNAKSVHRQIALLGGLIPDLDVVSERGELLQQVSVFDTRELTSLIKKAGMKVELCETYMFKPLPHFMFDHLIGEGLIDDRVWDGMRLFGESLPGVGAEICLVATEPR